MAIGGAVGWLAGLSVSPVANTVIGALLGLIGGLGAGTMVLASAGLMRRSAAAPAGTPSGVDLRPIAVLALAIAVAVPVGILARSHNLFGADLVSAAGAPSSAASPQSGVLFSERLSACAELMVASRSADDERFRAMVEASSPRGAELARQLPIENLRTVVRVLCAG
jgi:hypothetical protein